MPVPVDKNTPVGSPLTPVVKGWGAGPFVYLGNGRGGGTIKFATKKDGMQQARASDFIVDLDAVRKIVRMVVKEKGRQSLTPFERAVIAEIEAHVGGV